MTTSVKLAALVLVTGLFVGGLGGGPVARAQEQSPGVPNGTQNIAPAGGTTTQQGVDTRATTCPDGKAPTTDNVCSDVGQTTSNSGGDTQDTTGGTPIPTIK